MTTGSKKPLKLFYCYAREDKALRNELDIHLSSLKRQKLVTSWYDGEIGPGTEWEKEIDTHLRNADIILLLVTPHFMASDYCYDTEMKRALERHQAGTVRVIPVILRSTFWKDAPFSSLQILPTDAKPVAKWADRDEAFCDITEGVHKAVLNLHLLLENRERIEKANALYNLKRYEEALVAYEQAIRLDPNDATAYNGKGWTLLALDRDEEALAAYEQAIYLDPNNTEYYDDKGELLCYYLGRYEEALLTYEQAIHLDPNNADYYRAKGDILYYNLKHYEEALVAYEQAIRLDPNYAKGHVLNELNRSKEAQKYYEKARQLK